MYATAIRYRSPSFTLIASILVMSATVACGDRSAPGQHSSMPGNLTLKTDRVVVFKDGYALIVKTGTDGCSPMRFLTERFLAVSGPFPRRTKF